MKIIVTGGTGFLGKQVMTQLIKRNHEVFNYDIVEGCDILNKTQIESVIQSFQPTTMIHLAACSDLNIYRDKPEISYRINVIGTRNLLQLCENYSIRLLFASTCCCYGNNHCHPSDETSPLAPTEPYAKSKQQSEKDIVAVGLPHCCMRLATFYGPEMRAALAPAVFLDKAHKNETIQILFINFSRLMEIKKIISNSNFK